MSSSAEHDGAPAPNTPIVLGRYRLRRVIGKGAMGEVWAAQHELVDHEIAVKVVLDENSGGALAARALYNEVSTATGLNHPGVVSVLDHGRVDLLAHTVSDGRMPVGGPFLVMELLQGHSMHEFIGRLTWLEVQEVLSQLLDALGHCHGRGVIHRDLKPGNILLGTGVDRRFRVVLMDFGLARFFEQPVERSETVAGTPAYMAPEQLQGAWRRQGPWTDLYSVGCLGWTLVTGAPPFGRRRSYEDFLRDHLQLRPPPLDPMIGVPVDVEIWLRRLLAKSPADRFATAADARDALLDLPSGIDDSPTLEPVAPPVRVGGHQEPGSFGELELGDLLSTADLQGQAGGMPLLDDDTQDFLGEMLPVIHEASTTEILKLTTKRAPLPPSWRLPRAVVRHPLDGVGLSLFGLRDPPLMGRLAERDLLWSALLEVEQSRMPQVVVLHGDSGVGRSRLAAWLCETAHEQSGVLSLRAMHGLEGDAEAGLAAMFRRHLRLAGLAPRQVADHLRYQLGQPAVDAAELRALMAVLATGDGDDEAEGTRLFVEARERHMLFSRLLERLLVGGPLRPESDRPGILWLDDVHHSHESLSFAVHLMVASNPLPLLVVATSGDHEADVAQAILLARLQSLATHVLNLEGLPTADHRALVDALLVFAPEVAAHITERTAGNPRFAVQLVADWVQRGLLQAGPEGFTVPAEDLADAPVDPLAIWQRSLSAALAELGDADVEALEVAAALGVRVDNQEWRAVCARSRLRPSSDLVDAAVRFQLVDRRPGGFEFGHRVIVDSLRAHATAGGRATRHHRVCATMVELRHQGPASETAARVARHLLRAGDTRDALTYLLQAARGFARVGETAQVIPLLDSWEAAAREVGLADDAHDWTTVWGLRLDALWLSGDKAHVRAVARLAAGGRGAPQLVGLAHLHRGLSVYQRGAVSDARMELSRAAAAAESAGSEELLVRVGLERGRLSLESGDLDGALRRLEAVRLQAHKLRDTRAEATAGWLMGRVAKQSGDLAQARSAFVAALSAFERVGDRKGGRITTSEGQAYGMLQAVWIGDQDTFERIDRWTVRHLQSGDPAALPAWKHGRKGLRRRVLDPQPATDADILIAWSLLLAAERWNDPRYSDRAKALVRTIWDTEVHRVGDRLVLLPGPWAADSRPLRLNPSYFLPFAMRAFAVVDPAHDWTTLIDDGYAILAESTQGGLAPDWLYLDPVTGVRVPAPEPAHELHGFESMRLPFMLAAEVQWFDEPRARALLSPYTAWQTHYTTQGWLPALAHADGFPAADYPHLALYGALLPAWAIDSPRAADQLYATSIAPTRGPDGWGDPNDYDYYAQNWIWFGLALWTGLATPPELTP